MYVYLFAYLFVGSSVCTGNSSYLILFVAQLMECPHLLKLVLSISQSLCSPLLSSPLLSVCVTPSYTICLLAMQRDIDGKQQNPTEELRIVIFSALYIRIVVWFCPSRNGHVDGNSLLYILLWLF